jgi:hypothetical protein
MGRVSKPRRTMASRRVDWPAAAIFGNRPYRRGNVAVASSRARAAQVRGRHEASGHGQHQAVQEEFSLSDVRMHMQVHNVVNERGRLEVR